MAITLATWLTAELASSSDRANINVTIGYSGGSIDLGNKTQTTSTILLNGDTWENNTGGDKTLNLVTMNPSDSSPTTGHATGTFAISVLVEDNYSIDFTSITFSIS